MTKVVDPGNFFHYNRVTIGERAQRYANRSSMSVWAFIDYPSVPEGIDPGEFWLITVSEGKARRVGGDDVIEFTKRGVVHKLPPGSIKTTDEINKEFGY